MDITIKREEFSPNGVFGEMYDDKGNKIGVTLEHSFNGTPKVAPGTYTCLRHAPNRLPYETFELQNVPDFEGKPVTGILIHIGNYSSDSDGCILVGDQKNGDMIMNSKLTFAKFMELQDNVNEFTLVIE